MEIVLAAEPEGPRGGAGSPRSVHSLAICVVIVITDCTAVATIGVHTAVVTGITNLVVVEEVAVAAVDGVAIAGGTVEISLAIVIEVDENMTTSDVTPVDTILALMDVPVHQGLILHLQLVQSAVPLPMEVRRHLQAHILHRQPLFP